MFNSFVRVFHVHIKYLREDVLDEIVIAESDYVLIYVKLGHAIYVPEPFWSTLYH